MKLPEMIKAPVNIQTLLTSLILLDEMGHQFAVIEQSRVDYAIDISPMTESDEYLTGLQIGVKEMIDFLMELADTGYKKVILEETHDEGKTILVIHPAKEDKYEDYKLSKEDKFNLN